MNSNKIYIGWIMSHFFLQFRNKRFFYSKTFYEKNSAKNKFTDLLNKIKFNFEAIYFTY